MSTTMSHAIGLGSYRGQMGLYVVVRAVFLVLATVLLFPVQFANAQFDHPVALNVHAAGDEEAGRIVIDFDRPVEASPQLLEHPWRLVLDFDRIGFGFEPKTDNWKGMVRDIRWGDMSAVTSRMIFEMDQPFIVTKIESFESASTETHRMVISVSKAGSAEFKAALLDSMQTSAVVNRDGKADRLGAGASAASEAKAFKVVIDPGHGGIDPGAIGRKKTLEKEITLAFSKLLEADLKNNRGVDVSLTRTTDVFLPLNDRVQIARQKNADLFISIHADSLKQRNVRGATVYTISDEASDSVAAEIADRENRADAIAGLTFDDEPEDVSDILIDLARRETLGFSVQFARLAVNSIQKETPMIKNPHRYAGFRVLKGPDVPSVLIELGFLSNAEDEKLLNREEWRQKVSQQIAEAIMQYAELSGREVAKVDGN